MVLDASADLCPDADALGQGREQAVISVIGWGLPAHTAMTARVLLLMSALGDYQAHAMEREIMAGLLVRLFMRAHCTLG